MFNGRLLFLLRPVQNNYWCEELKSMFTQDYESCIWVLALLQTSVKVANLLAYLRGCLLENRYTSVSEQINSWKRKLFILPQIYLLSYSWKIWKKKSLIASNWSGFDYNQPGAFAKYQDCFILLFHFEKCQKFWLFYLRQSSNKLNCALSVWLN